MKGLSFRKGPRPPSEAVAEVVDIDVTPVMNMFIILIPFLVSMAVFTHLSIIEFSLPPNVGAGLDPSAGKPKLKLTVIVTPDFLAVTLGERMLDSIPLLAGEYRLDVLQERLRLRREQADIKDEAVIASRDGVRFKHLVQIMDRCREAGFEKIGLSSATESPEGGI